MKKITAIKNCQIVLEDRILFDAILLIEDEKIKDYGKENELKIPEGAEIIDAGGKYVGPGFVDIHIHGVDGKNINFETEEAGEYFLKHGATTLLATPWYKLDFDTTIAAIKNIKEKMPLSRNVRGIYMEGPYTNQKYGSHAINNPWKQGIVAEEYRAIVDEAGEYAKVWTIAPEVEGIEEFLKYAREVNPNTVFAVGHSEATPEQIKKLGRYRPTLETHATNATGKVAEENGIWGTGPDTYCFANDEVYCELISDSCGIHVKTANQQLMLHCKGADRIVLITDASAYKNPTPERYAEIKDINFSPQGEVAGSKLTMDMACHNMMSHTRAGMVDIFNMASRNPARVIGLGEEIGTVDIGKYADLVIVDDKFNIDKVILRGEIV